MPGGLGALLAQFHGAIALRRRRFGGRGVHRRTTLAAHVSARIGAAIDAGALFYRGNRAATRLIDAVAEQRARIIAPFEAADRLGLVPVVVHGDYGSTNVLFQREHSGWRPAAVFDLEDSGPGDPAEDFKWPALDSLRQQHPFALSDMLDAYQARRRLDDGARERMRGHAIVLALEASSWSDADDEWRDDMTAALGLLLSGDDPLGLL